MKVTACLIVKDEAPYLLEWLSFYLALGFDEIVVYDNASQDCTADVIELASANDPRIRYQYWPDIPGHAPQRSAYQDALVSIPADWIAFLDIDEFLILKQARTIHEFLDAFPSDAGAVSVNWRHFGSSGYMSYAQELILDRFRLCPTRSFYRNEFVKSIVRPDLTRAMTAHIPHLAGGVHYRVDGSLYPQPGHTRCAPPIHHPAQVNHYVIKSREEYKWKSERGRATMPPDDPQRRDKFGEEHWQRYDVNVERDDVADVWLDKVQAGTNRLARGIPVSPSHPVADGDPRSRQAAASVRGAATCAVDERARLQLRVVEGSLRYVGVSQQVQLQRYAARVESAVQENRRLRREIATLQATDARSAEQRG